MTHRTFVAAALASALFALGATAGDGPARPGPTDAGFLLPNGWTITPAGKQVPLSDLPLNIIPLADGKHALIATSGYNKHELSIVDLESLKVVERQTVRQSWFGLAVSPEQDRVWWSGGGAAMLHTYDLKDLKLTLTSPAEPEPVKPKADDKPAEQDKPKITSFRSGVFFDAKNQMLYSLDINKATLTATKLGDAAVEKTAPCGVRPYDVLLGRNGALLYVSDWAGRAVLAVDVQSLRVVAKIPVGEHPNQLALHPTDDRLFVACASSNSVAVIDQKAGVVLETIRTSLFPHAPEGSTPDALAVAPDGKTLYVANADNNCVAVIDISDPRKSQVTGFIPTGWYPTAVAVTPGRGGATPPLLLVGVGKGNETKPNPLFTDKNKPGDDVPKGPDGKPSTPFPYIGNLMSGALSVVPVPDEKKLAEYTAVVYRNCPYSDKLLAAAPPSAERTAIPAKPGDPSPIKYVIYIIKENRTYDQVFGDLKQGDGDPALVMFGRDVTPNHHKLAEEFVLLDNLYCNGQVSRDGHPWSTMAYHTDYIARDWHLTYSKRKGVEDDDDGDLSNAPSGYLWDACARAGLGYRSYGEYGKRVSTGDGAAKMEGRVPGLVGHICPEYYAPPAMKGVKKRDPDNVDIFLKEYNDFVQNGTMPRFIVMSLGEDHTTGTTVGTFTPRACVASNDLALGRLIEAVSHGPLWKETAIFVIEDDAQNGADHVDCHRTVGLVVSPYTKRGAVDSTQYSTVSMVRTMELILGLEPLSQYDAAARPMFPSFTDKADLKPFDAEKARIDLTEVNTKKTYGAERSGKMDFSDYDLADDCELNEILWRSIKGADAPLPPAVRAAIADRPASK
ncbi:MAG TPA: alkaline phosphatase family protein [Gemmataceae bacterium]|nr:alkaline phosphatase family protein [Gemmataceae bacterium]